MTDPAALVAELETILTVENAGGDRFVGHRVVGDEGRIFGGEIIAQALAAAMRTVDADRIIHSLHAYFIRPGNVSVPARYDVDRDQDGRSFSARRVTASQQGDVILNMSCSFQKLEEGLSYGAPMPDVPGPDGLLSTIEINRNRIDEIPEAMRARVTQPGATEMRPSDPGKWTVEGPQEAHQAVWMRMGARISDDANLHRIMLAYMSDYALLGTCTLPHGLSWMRNELTSASLDHAVWFHDEARVDDWLLFDMVSPWSARGRGMNHGRVYTRDGRLIASIAQEGMIRKRRTAG